MSRWRGELLSWQSGGTSKLRLSGDSRSLLVPGLLPFLLLLLAEWLWKIGRDQLVLHFLEGSCSELIC